MANLKASKNKMYYWAILPDLYLASSLILLDKIKDDFSSNSLKYLQFRSHHPDYELIWPAVYSFKHGVELYIKGLGNISHGEYENIHDIKKLFDVVVNKSHDGNRVILKDLKKSTWNILEKYYYGTYLPGNKKGRADIDNIAERYPENKKAYRIPDTYLWVKQKLVQDIKNDIRFIHEKFWEAKVTLKDS